jgi:hypothetical protein
VYEGKAKSCLKLIDENTGIVDVGERFFPPNFGAVAADDP